MAWKTGSSRSHAEALSAVARRAEELPRCVGGLRSGSLSLDQVAVIAERAVSGTTREIPRRVRRALERRHPTCAVPGCGATRGLHAHHLWHWEDGGPTEPYRGPTGERAQWKWYEPFAPRPSSSNN